MGAVNRLLLVVCLFYVVASTITVAVNCIIRAMNAQLLFLSNQLDSVFFAVPLFTVLFTYVRCPKSLNDELFFEYEFRNTAIIYVCGFVIYTLSAILDIAGYQNSSF